MVKLYLENNSTTPASIVQVDSDPTPVGYTETNTISDWDYYGRQRVGIIILPNMLSLRTIIKNLVITKGFSNCTLEEKIIGSQWFVVDKVDRDTVRTEEEQSFDAQDILLRIQSDYDQLCLFSDDNKLVQIKVDNAGNSYIEIL